jgi:hypothetical protein
MVQRIMDRLVPWAQLGERVGEQPLSMVMWIAARPELGPKIGSSDTGRAVANG